MDQPHWVTRTNGLGGESLFILSGADLTQVPSAFRELLTDAHVEAFAHPRKFFSSLAERSKLDGMRQWFDAMAPFDCCGLQIHTADMFGHRQTEVTIRGRLPWGASWPESWEFRLASGRPIEDLPFPLDNLYELIDGTSEHGWSCAGGIEGLDDLLLDYESSYPISTLPPLDLDSALSFYIESNGDRLLTDGTNVFWFLHEDCSFVPAGELTHVLNTYFLSALTGERWLSDPYESN